MSAIVCLSLDTRSGTRTRTGTRTDVGEQHNALIAPILAATGIAQTSVFTPLTSFTLFLNNFPINSNSKILRPRYDFFFFSFLPKLKPNI